MRVTDVHVHLPDSLEQAPSAKVSAVLARVSRPPRVNHPLCLWTEVRLSHPLSKIMEYVVEPPLPVTTFAHFPAKPH